MMRLLGQLAWLNIGHIDWEEYIPTMYARFMRIFRLPVYYKKVGHIKMSIITEDRVASWIVWTLVRVIVLQSSLFQQLYRLPKVKLFFIYF